jgi:uncharacterized protein GlcG (DUF336 family)
MFKSRPDPTGDFSRQIINLPATRLRTLGHYWKDMMDERMTALGAREAPAAPIVPGSGGVPIIGAQRHHFS